MRTEYQMKQSKSPKAQRISQEKPKKLKTDEERVISHLLESLPLLTWVYFGCSCFSLFQGVNKQSPEKQKRLVQKSAQWSVSRSAPKVEKAEKANDGGGQKMNIWKNPASDLFIDVDYSDRLQIEKLYQPQKEKELVSLSFWYKLLYRRLSRA